jgi:hypothetical protein
MDDDREIFVAKALPNHFYFHLAAQALTGADYTMAKRQLRREGLTHDALPQTAKATPFLTPDYTLKFKLSLTNNQSGHKWVEAVRVPDASADTIAYLPLATRVPVSGALAPHQGFNRAAKEVFSLRAEPNSVVATNFSGSVYLRLPKPKPRTPLQWLKNIATPAPIIAMPPDVFRQLYQRRFGAPEQPTAQISAFVPRKTLPPS